MNNDKNDFFDFSEDENPIQIKQVIGKYLAYWPWFLASVGVIFLLAYFYLRYTDLVYETSAKVEILADKEDSNFSIDITKIFNKSSVNLENEIALFKSYRLSDKVVRNLKLNINYYDDGKVRSRKIYNAPIVVSFANQPKKLIENKEYEIRITKSGYTITDQDSEESISTKGYFFTSANPNFPIHIIPERNQNISSLVDSKFTVILTPISKAVLQLNSSITVEADGKDSDIISLVLQGSNARHSRFILNNLIKVFEEDGIKDKQEVSRRTIDFVDERFVSLKRDLDSIEKNKKNYKKSNALSFIEVDAQASVLNKSTKNDALFAVESQLLLAQLVEDNLVNQKGFDLLPTDVGLESVSVNQLVDLYNTSVLEYQKLHTSAGNNNPSVQGLASVLANEKRNILQSLKGYKQKLESSRKQSELAQIAAEGSFSTLPEKEKVLRSIERQQNLKESLYLLLLQKREEAAINLAVTVPNTKIIDYAISDDNPVAPKKNRIYLGALALGLLLPFGILFLIFKWDNKIHSANDVESSSKNNPILAELPSISEYKESVSQTLEAFRTLAQNTSFIIPFSESKLGKILFVTSSIKGEGKTFVSYNLATAYSNLNKKVLIIGSDLRNPQLHKYLDQNRKDNKGLANYLHESSLKWEDLILKTKDNEYNFDVLLAGAIPPNPTLLLSSSRFETFIEEIRKVYDIVVFDTPPTLLVTDTLIISKFADTTIYVVRAGVTEKHLIAYSNKLVTDKKINNMGYVINDVNFKSAYGYGYGYSYGYGYGYNYGYGYGYGKDSDSKPKPWYKAILGKLFSKDS